jgi:catechol 2,3-dioxygenase-like lactoylglutathione lyase family enzyme
MFRLLLLIGVLIVSNPISSASSAESTQKKRQDDAAATVTVRYIVTDVPASVDFYTKHLGFSIALDARPAFAVVARGALRLALSGVGGQGGGSRQMPDGRKPESGGWNRFQIVVTDLESEVTRLRAAGAKFRNDIVKGNGGLQILLDDPSGNPIELFQPY